MKTKENKDEGVERKGVRESEISFSKGKVSIYGVIKIKKEEEIKESGRKWQKLKRWEGTQLEKSKQRKPLYSNSTNESRTHGNGTI